MRTTIRIDEGLYRRVEADAARTGRSISEVIEDAVRLALQPREADEGTSLPEIPVYGGTGVLPGVGLTDTVALRDVMDDDRPARA